MSPGMSEDDFEDMTDDDLDAEMEMECPYCDGDGWQTDGVISIECPECGGTGWY